MKNLAQTNYSSALQAIRNLKEKHGNTWATIRPENVARIAIQNRFKTGLDIAKCIALGADLAGIAGPFIKTAVISVDESVRLIKEITREIQIAMFATGASNLKDLEQKLLKIK